MKGGKVLVWKKNLSSKGDVVKPWVSPAVDVADLLLLDLPLRKSLRSNPLPRRSLETQSCEQRLFSEIFFAFNTLIYFYLSLHFPIVWPAGDLKPDVKVLEYEFWSTMILRKVHDHTDEQDGLNDLLGGVGGEGEVVRRDDGRAPWADKEA